MNFTSSATDPAVQRHWAAELHLETRQRRSGTRLTAARHKGPLRVQKPFYQSDASCHLYLLHPPGGVVGGDTLNIRIDAGPDTRTLLTSPSATRFYRSPATTLQQFQDVVIDVGEQAHLDWLPLETIIFEGSEARLTTRVSLAASATYVGWDMLALGRRASGEGFESGSVCQSIRIKENGQLLHRERFELDAANRELGAAAWGAGGASLVGTFVAVSRGCTHETSGSDGRQHLDRVVATLQGSFSESNWGITARGRLILVRYLGHSAERCRQGFEQIRAAIAGAGLLNREGSGPYPRIWNT